MQGATQDVPPGRYQDSTYLSHSHSYNPFPHDSAHQMIAGPGHGVISMVGAATTQTQIAGDKPLGSISPHETRPVNIYVHGLIRDGSAADNGGAGSDSPLPVPVGAVILWAGALTDRLPSGWLACAGGKCPAEAPELTELLKRTHPFGQADGVPLLPDLGGLFVRGVQLEDGNGESDDPDWRRRVAGRRDSAHQEGVGSIQHQAIAGHTHQYIQLPGEFGGAIAAAAEPFYSNEAAAPTQVSGGEVRPASVSVMHLIKATSESAEAPPIGTIVMYASDGDALRGVSGWAECDGTSFGPNDFKTLAGVLGGTYLPRLTGRFARGVDAATPKKDLDRDGTRFIGGKQNAGVLSVQASALAEHSHQVTKPEEQSRVVFDPVVGGRQVYDGDYGDYNAIGHGWSGKDGPTTLFPDPSTGESHASNETRPENIALYFMISTGSRSPAQ